MFTEHSQGYRSQGGQCGLVRQRRYDGAKKVVRNVEGEGEDEGHREGRAKNQGLEYFQGPRAPKGACSLVVVRCSGDDGLIDVVAGEAERRSRDQPTLVCFGPARLAERARSRQSI